MCLLPMGGSVRFDVWLGMFFDVWWVLSICVSLPADRSNRTTHAHENASSLNEMHTNAQTKHRQQWRAMLEQEIGRLEAAVP